MALAYRPTEQCDRLRCCGLLSSADGLDFANTDMSDVRVAFVNILKATAAVFAVSGFGDDWIRV